MRRRDAGSPAKVAGGVSRSGEPERGPGFVTASVVDPFGDVLGIMYNRHNPDILANLRRSAVGDPF
jgi:hypothetical protein